jgi:hypothetical protein
MNATNKHHPIDSMQSKQTKSTNNINTNQNKSIHQEQKTKTNLNITLTSQRRNIRLNKKYQSISIRICPKRICPKRNSAIEDSLILSGLKKKYLL